MPPAVDRVTSPGCIACTRALNWTSTPSLLRRVWAAVDRVAGMAFSSRSPGSTSTMRVSSGFSCRNSRRMVLRISSETAPAISQPVGPPPTITTVCRNVRAAGSGVCSACSIAISSRRRISSACSRIFIGGANVRQSSWPKKVLPDPVASTRWS